MILATCPTWSVSSLNFGGFPPKNFRTRTLSPKGLMWPLLKTMMLLMQMKIHGQSLESLYNEVPMRLLPVEYLPDDYKGSNAGTEREIIGNNSNRLHSLSILNCHNHHIPSHLHINSVSLILSLSIRPTCILYGVIIITSRVMMRLVYYGISLRKSITLCCPSVCPGTA